MPTATLGNVHLTVGDVDRVVEFHADVLGIAVRERHGRFAFLSGDDRHHELALQGVGADASAAAPDETPAPRIGLYHSAWAVAVERWDGRTERFDPHAVAGEA